MKSILIVLIIVFGSLVGRSQDYERIVMSTQDSNHFYFGDGESTDLFYDVLKPKNKPVGVLVIFPSGGQLVENLEKEISLPQNAIEQNMLVVIPSFNWGTFQRIPDIEFLNEVFKNVCEKYHVSKDHFVFCGLSNGGMVSLTYAIHAEKFQSTYLKPIGVIGLDPFLDNARFYRYCEREVKRGFSEAGVAESKFFLNVYNQIYGGPPDEYPEAYMEASTYSFGAPKGGNTQFLNDVGILMFSDLNTDFLINQRRRDLYDWNGIDIVSFVNQLKINGNPNASVIISQNQGKRMDGTANPHSWSILQDDVVMKWINDLLDAKK